MVTSEQIERWRSNPLAYMLDMHLPVKGGTRFGDIISPEQLKFVQAFSPALLALALNETAPTQRFFAEWTKAHGKESVATIGMSWLLLFALRRMRIQIAASDQSQADEVRLIVKELLQIDAPANQLTAMYLDVQATVIKGSKDSTAEIITTDARGAHGSRPDLTIICELKNIGNEGFPSALMSNADKMPDSLVLITTNAGILDSWQHKWAIIAEESPLWFHSAIKFPAPWIRPEALEEARRRDPSQVHESLHYGKWSTGSGDALEYEDIKACVKPDLKQLAWPEPGWTYYGGADLSTKWDRSAVCVIGKERKTNRRRLASLQTWGRGQNGRIDLIAVQRAIEFLSKRFRCQTFAFDPFQAELMYQQLTEAGVKMWEVPASDNHLRAMASVCLETFRNRDIDLYCHDELVADLRKLVIVEKPNSSYKLDAPRNKDGHADAATSLCLSMYAASAGRHGTQFFIA